MGATEQLRALADAGVVERASGLIPSPARLLPVLEPLGPLLPDGALRRGSTTAISGAGATSVALALASRASREGSVGVVGMPSLGLVWAASLGVALERLVVVPAPGRELLTVLAAFADAFDVVVSSLPRLRDRDARKLAGHVREQRSVLLALGDTPDADLHLRGTDARWHGIDRGHGHLAARTVTVTVTGRGSASRPRTVELWLPDEDGRVAIVERPAVIPLRA